jgi:hypothetical protein
LHSFPRPGSEAGGDGHSSWPVYIGASVTVTPLRIGGAAERAVRAQGAQALSVALAVEQAQRHVGSIAPERGGGGVGARAGGGVRHGRSRGEGAGGEQGRDWAIRASIGCGNRPRSHPR